MKHSKLTNDKYLSVEIPYKLNVLYSFINWHRISSSREWNDIMDTMNTSAIYCSLYESSILFGRHVLSFFGVSVNQDVLVRPNKRKTDIDITDVLKGHKLIDLQEDLLLGNSKPIIYLLKIANKRVAHATWKSDELGKTDVNLITSAQETIHELVEKYVPSLNQNLLLKYNHDAFMVS